MQRIAGEPARRHIQPERQQPTAIFLARAGQHFHRQCPLVPVLVAVGDDKQSAPILAIAVAGVGNDFQMGAEPCPVSRHLAGLPVVALHELVDAIFPKAERPVSADRRRTILGIASLVRARAVQQLPQPFH